MLPYILSQANPQGAYSNYANVHTSHHTSENRITLHNSLICYIVEFMYEFCSKKYGHDIDITSYNNFCEKWWSRQDRELINIPIFEIHYFEKDEWKEWKIEDYKNEIYDEYTKKVNEKMNMQNENAK